MGDFLFKISKQKRQNFALLSSHCQSKVNFLLDKLNTHLNDFVMQFNEIKMEGGAPLMLESRQLSHMSDREEEKVPGDLSRMKSTKAAAQVRLDSVDERALKQHLKVHEESEVLYRIFKLFNLFYDKFSAE